MPESQRGSPILPTPSVTEITPAHPRLQSGTLYPNTPGPRREMTSYLDISCHIVFATKNRIPALAKDRRDDLYRFIWGIVTARNCHLYRISGVEDHAHILTSLHPSVCLADLVKEIETASSRWIRGEQAFPDFEHWQDGYGAFAVNAAGRPAVIEYIRSQEAHHATQSFADELQGLVTGAGLAWKPEYLP